MGRLRSSTARHTLHCTNRRTPMLLRFVLLVLLPLSTCGIKWDYVLRVENPPVNPSSRLGLFWQNEQHLGAGLNQSQHFTDALVAVLRPGEVVRQRTNFGHEFVLRTNDFKTRVRVIVDKGATVENGDTFPYEIAFVNLNGDAEKSSVEMRLGDNDYQWIESNHRVKRLTDDYQFEIRHNEKPVAFVSLHARSVHAAPQEGEA